MQKRNYLGTLSLFAAGALLLSACGEAATPIVAPTNTTAAAGPTETPTPCACSAPPPTAATATSAPATSTGGSTGQVTIGFAFVTSGDNAVYGASQKAAAQMAIDEINAAGKGPKLIPVFEDTAGKPDQAFTVFQKFINADKVDAIIGPTLSNEAQTSDPEAQKDAVPVLAVSNTAGGITDIGDYIFRDFLAEVQVIPETVKQAKDKAQPHQSLPHVRQRRRLQQVGRRRIPRRAAEEQHPDPQRADLLAPTTPTSRPN